MQILERTAGFSSRVAVFLLTAGSLATLCPFYLVKHHIWIFALLPALLLLKEDFLTQEVIPVVPTKSPSRLLLFFAFLGAAVPVIFTLFTWFNEFPWRGDYNFHLPESRVLSHSDWVIAVFALWALLGLAFFLFHRKIWRTSGIVFALIGLFVIFVGQRWPLPLDFARYPATVYILQSPLFWLAQAVGAPQSINLNRLFESFAFVAWLFVLRPLVLRKKLSWSVVVTVWLLVTQGDTLYYLGGAYLEPWSLIFCLLALEACLVDGDFRLTFAFIGLAAIIKEQAVLLFPFFILAAWSREGFRWHRLFNLGLWGCFSMLPFLCYFLYRRDANVWRTAEMASLTSLTNPDRIHEFCHRVAVQFSSIGVFLLLFLIAAALVIAWRRERRLLTPELFIIGGALFLPLFFYCDRISAGWTGYPRFHLVSFFLVTFLTTYLALRSQSKSLTLAVMLAVFGAVQIPRFAHVWQFRNETSANFFEHYDAPIFLPIRRLFAEMERSQALTPGSTVQVVELAEFQDLRQFDLGYPDLAAQYKVTIPSKPSSEAKFEDPAVRPLWVMVPYIRMANLNAEPGSSNLYDQFNQQERAITDLGREIVSSGGSWTQVRNDKHQLLGFVGRLK